MAWTLTCFVEFHLYIENPPQDLGDRWSQRSLRCLTVVKPGSLDPTGTETDKQRFLDNLWTTQAKYRTRAGQSVVLQSVEMDVTPNGSSRVTTARTYYNVYQRNAFLQEAKKAGSFIRVTLICFAYFPVDEDCRTNRCHRRSGPHSFRCQRAPFCVHTCSTFGGRSVGFGVFDAL